jgi:hypothetical protein
MTLNLTGVWSWPAAALLAASLASTNAVAQTFFYTEVMKDGRIYVFAAWTTYDAFLESAGAETGPRIERPGYGPHGETVVFDSEDAINLYNYKHGLPGEHFAKTEKKPEPKFPSSKIGGLMFGDYYWFYQSHRDQVSSADRKLNGFAAAGSR